MRRKMLLKKIIIIFTLSQLSAWMIVKCISESSFVVCQLPSVRCLPVFFSLNPPISLKYTHIYCTIHTYKHTYPRERFYKGVWFIKYIMELCSMYATTTDIKERHNGLHFYAPPHVLFLRTCMYYVLDMCTWSMREIHTCMRCIYMENTCDKQKGKNMLCSQRENNFFSFFTTIRYDMMMLMMFMLLLTAK